MTNTALVSSMLRIEIDKSESVYSYVSYPFVFREHLCFRRSSGANSPCRVANSCVHGFEADFGRPENSLPMRNTSAAPVFRTSARLFFLSLKTSATLYRQSVAVAVKVAEPSDPALRDSPPRGRRGGLSPLHTGS